MTEAEVRDFRVNPDDGTRLLYIQEYHEQRLAHVDLTLTKGTTLKAGLLLDGVLARKSWDNLSPMQ